MVYNHDIKGINIYPSLTVSPNLVSQKLMEYLNLMVLILKTCPLKIERKKLESRKLEMCSICGALFSRFFFVRKRRQL